VSYNFSTNNIIEFINKNNTSSDFSFTNNYCIYKASKSHINEDIFLYKQNITTSEDIKIIEDQFPYRGIYLDVCLEGSRIHNNLISNTEIDYRKSYKTTLFLNNLEGESYFPKKSQYKSISIFVNENFIPKNLLDKIKTKQNSTLLNYSPSSLKVNLLAQEIYNSPFIGDLNDVYIQSKALELLHFELLNIDNLIDDKKMINHIKFSDYDIEALKKAKNIIIDSIETPPSISSLSKKVKLNEFKLKIGFKILYGMPPYEFYLEHRMNKAKELLSTGEYNISEIASLVGYKHIQSFSNAFRKRHGINPKDLIQKRNYYY